MHPAAHCNPIVIDTRPYNMENMKAQAASNLYPEPVSARCMPERTPINGPNKSQGEDEWAVGVYLSAASIPELSLSRPSSNV